MNICSHTGNYTNMRISSCNRKRNLIRDSSVGYTKYTNNNECYMNRLYFSILHWRARVRVCVQVTLE